APLRARDREPLARVCVADRSSGVDEREVAEPLREVAEEPAALRVDLLGEQTDVVRVTEHLPHRPARLGDPPCARERLDEPERAGHERALGPLLPAVPIEESAARVE